MKLHTLGRMVIAFASVVAALAGCSWENPLYTNFVENGDVVFCPTMDENGVREKKTFDYFYFGENKKCTVDNYTTCVQEVLEQMDHHKDSALYNQIAKTPFYDSFRLGICPIGFNCLQDFENEQDENEIVWYCKLSNCKSDEISCGGSCLKKTLNVESCDVADEFDPNDDRLVCKEGFIDCDEVLSNGCELDINEKHVQSCLEQSINACEIGYLDCDGLLWNGCEVNQTVLHVRECFEQAITECEDGYLDCDGIIINGCESSLKNHVVSCEFIDDQPTITKCETGFADCDNDYANGCEVNVFTSNEYCGADEYCNNGVICSPVQKCERGTCLVNCGELTLCESEDNSSCVDIQNDPWNCGGCNKSCYDGRPNNGIVKECNNGQCVFECLKSYDMVNHDGILECIDPMWNSQFCGPEHLKCDDGKKCESGKCVVDECVGHEVVCEINGDKQCIDIFGNDVEHCGGCNYRCSNYLPGIYTSVKACDLGNCLYKCENGYINCGSESELKCVSADSLKTDSLNCGGCGKQCKPGESCLDGKCILTSCTNPSTLCVSGDNRYCANIAGNDASNCGSCGYVCSNHSILNASSNTCGSGQCSYKCNTGYTNCGKGNLANSIKCINVKANDISNCGGCENVCPSTKKTGGVLSGCKAGVCQYKCNSGYTNCGSATAPSCRNTKGNDNDNCGGCDKECSKPANAKSAQCRKGTCKITCKSGYKLKKGKCVK